MSNYRLPTYFEIEDERFDIRESGDYRIVLSCFNILYDNELTEQERLYACLLVFYDTFEDLEDLLAYGEECIQELTNKMFWFFDCGDNYDVKQTNHKRLIDWDKDEMLISSAVNRVAGKEIRLEEFVHWWTFIGYYMAIGECSLATIVGIRSKIANGEKLEKYEKKFKYENPQYFNIDFRTNDEKADDDWIQALWNSNGGAK